MYPNSAPDVIPDIADRYAVDYLLVDFMGLPTPLQSLWNSPPAFLRDTGIPALSDARMMWRLYEIVH
ncbi:MAG: hypothetical protein U0670_01365 [Anaerolineae bacterium]